MLAFLPDQGARFEVHLVKARGIYGDDAKPFEAQLETKDGADHWLVKSLEDANEDRVIEATKEGLSLREIAKELGGLQVDGQQHPPPPQVQGDRGRQGRAATGPERTSRQLRHDCDERTRSGPCRGGGAGLPPSAGDASLAGSNEPCLNATRVASLFSAGSFRLGSQCPAI